MCNKKILFIIITLFLISCSKENETLKSDVLFTKLEKERTGITFQNLIKDSAELNILSFLYFYNGGGVSVADFNNDSLPDLYFTANQTADKLYLNKGNLKFQDVTDISEISNSTGWTTGVSSVDINNDGLMDIYVCKVGNYKNLNGNNLLYINQGINKDNIPVFKESSKEYNLNIKSFSTQSTFFDYDTDGDLDMFLLNHSVHPNRNYGKGSVRKTIDSLSGDKLLRNDDGKFVDVTNKSGIFQGKIGYGLGVSTSDLNNDNYPDIYVGNDFFENDYIYINQKNGTFKEHISLNNNYVGHTTHFSMGNDIADINNDGHFDIISVDMLPEDLKTYKTSGLEHNYQIYQNYLRNEYAPQFMQNTLHINNGNGKSFSETSFLSGVSSTEWSWSPLIADFDNDGLKDLFVTNGILGATNDMDFISFIANDKIQKQINDNTGSENLKFIKELPSKRTTNYLFKNNGDKTFSNVTKLWSNMSPSYSNGAIYSDLDNDGDLDLVVNNINEPAFVFENKSNNNYLKLKFNGSAKNLNGIGAKIILYTDSLKISQENFITRGYLSSVEPNIIIGLGNLKNVDSLQVTWPDSKTQTIYDIEANKEVTLNYEEANSNPMLNFITNNGFLKNHNSLFNYTHKDQNTTEFNRDPLIPYASTNLGPDISLSDINNDGLEDVFIGGSKNQSSTLYVQSKTGDFQSYQDNLFNEDKLSEDVSHAFFDANNDGFNDLIVVSGGNEFIKGKALQPRFYKNNKGTFVKDTIQFKNLELNASKVKVVDFDNDGDLDLSISSNLKPREFGITPQQYLFSNDGKGNFEEVTRAKAKDYEYLGNLQDLVWNDLNNDGHQDLVVVGHWMPISIFLNNGESLSLQKNKSFKQTNGWWNVVKVHDFDKDGDLDIIAGNWGLNTRLTASYKEPITLYRNDFDDNGSVEPIVTHYYQNEETAFASKEELVKQIPFLNKKFLSFSKYANSNFEDLFAKQKIKNSLKKHVYQLASCYFENKGNNSFKTHILPFNVQISSVFDIAIEDFNNDGYDDVLFVGNNYEISTQLSRLDASHGVLLLNDQNGFFKEIDNQQFNIPGASRNIEKITVKDEVYFIITRNNDTPVFLKKNK